MKLVGGLRICPLLVALFLTASRTDARLAVGSPPWPQGDEEEEEARDDEPPETLTPHEAIAKYLTERIKVGRPIVYFDVPEGANEATKKQSFDPQKTLDAFDQEIKALRGTEFDTPRKIFEAFHEQVTVKTAEAGGHGEEVARAIYETEWGERLIRATIMVQDANGESSPAAIKELIKGGLVDENFGRYMWFARDRLVRTTVRDKVTAELEAKHPELRFEITILDSGSYESIKSDVDKTPGLRAFDQDGNPVKAFGEGGRVLGGKIDAYVDLLFKAFDDLGHDKYGSLNRISRTLDTEFFANDTLLKRLGRAGTHASGSVNVHTLEATLREYFRALQRNPGPTYQFSAKIVAQVIGRVVEQDVMLRMEIAELGARRAQGVAADDMVAHVLREAVTSVHSPAVRIAKENGRYVIRSIGVVEYLATSGLDIRHSKEFAVHNALGDFEKLDHKQHLIIDETGRFHAEAFDAYLQDLAKYIDRLSKDMLNSLADPDEWGGRLQRGAEDPETARLRRSMGEFTEKFVPADDPVFLRERKPTFGREYTRAAHDSLYGSALEMVHGGDTRKTRAQLDLFWAVSRASEIALEIKNRPSMVDRIKGGGLGAVDPSLAARRSVVAGYPYDYVLYDVMQWIQENEPRRFGNLEGWDPKLALEQKLRVAKQLFTETGRTMAVVLIREHLPGQMELWLKPVDDAVARGLRLEGARLQSLQEQVAELRRKPAPAGSNADQELRSLERRLRECEADLDLFKNRPEEAKLRLRARAEETMRQFFFQFGLGEPHPRYQAMLANLSAEQRAVYDSMVPLWRSDFETGQAELLSRLYKIALDDVPVYGKAASVRLGRAYAELCGVDVDAFFARRAGGPVTGANSPDRVFGRFLANNYVHMGLADSGLRLLLIMEVSKDLPWAERMGMLGDAVKAELILGVPAIGPAYGIYNGYRMGDPMAMAGGVLNGATEMAQLWTGASALGLNSALPAAYVGGLDALAGLGGAAALYLSMARTAVEIVGHMAFDPLRDEYFQIAYRGYLEPERRGLIPPGLRGLHPDWPIVPITEPDGYRAFKFLFLDPEQAQVFLESLLIVQEEDAATALLTLAGSGGDLAFRKISSSFVIDLATDFDALITEVQRRDPAEAQLPGAHYQRLEEMRTNAVRLLRHAQALQRATWSRIEADRLERASVFGSFNVWLLAAQQNLALHFDDRFGHEVQLLYEALVGDPDSAATIRSEGREAWTRWAALAPSFESDASIRARFDSFMDTPAMYRRRLDDLRTAMAEADEIPWGLPSSMLSEYVGRATRLWMENPTDEDRARIKAIGDFEHQAVILHAFAENAFQNQPGRTHTEPYTLGAVLEWYAQQVHDKAIDVRTQRFRPDGVGTVAERIAEAQNDKAALELEQGLVMQSFFAIEGLVAPRVAQSLLTDWLAVRPPYDDEPNAALKFLWHDADAQQRIHSKLSGDLAQGRRLIPLFQAQRMAWRKLFHVERIRILKEYKLALEDQLRKFQRDSARVAQLNAEMRERPVVLPGDMDLQITPYIALGDDGLQIGMHSRVDHEVYRALDVEVGYDARVLPWDRIAEIAGRDRYDRALELAELEEESILFAVLVDAGVTKAVPPKGHEARAYTDPPPRRSHLLLVPGDRGRPEPEIMTQALVIAPLKPGIETYDVEDATAHEQCDFGAEPLFYHDDLWAFFTPEFPEGEPFDWRFRNDRDGGAGGGTHDPEGIWGESSSCASAPGAPAVFAGRVNASYSGPGVYTLQVRPAWIPSGAFGTGGSDEPPPWEDGESFEVFDGKLHFQGFVTEPISAEPLDEKWFRNGQLTLHPPLVEESHVALEIDAEWEGWKQERNPDTGEYEKVPSGERFRAASTLAIGFPPVLDPRAVYEAGDRLPLGELHFDLRSLEAGEDRAFSAAFSGMVATNQHPPSRALALDEEIKYDIGVLENLSIPADWGRWTGTEFRRGAVFGATDEGTMVIRSWDSPLERSLGWHLRDPQSLWVLPVYFRFLGEEEMFGFALYGARAEPYDGPSPEATGGDDDDDPDAVADAGSGEGSGAGGAGSSGAGGRGTGAASGLDPATVNPNEPDVAGHIRTWISVAEPPANATIGAQLHYTEWGVQVGTVPGGIITASGPPDAAAGHTPVEYVWSFRDDLDSVNHCTLGEYVMARLAGEGTTPCTGRYRAQPPDPLDDFEGRPAAGARRDALLDGLSVQVVGGDPAPTEEQEFTVQTQDPPPNSPVEIGDTLTLRVHSRRPPAPPVPDLTGLLAAVARQEVEDAGLQPDFVGGDPAPRAALAYTVQSQDPAAGADATPGSPVTIRIFSAYTEALHEVPDVRGLDVAAAVDRLAVVGLTISTVDGDRATRPEEAGRVQAQDPAPGVEVVTGARVTVWVRGAWVDPLRTVPDVFGLGLAAARQRLEDQGLAIATIDGAAVTQPGLAHTVAAQEPAAGQRVTTGTVVTLRMHGAFVAVDPDEPDEPVTGRPFYVVTHGGFPKLDVELAEGQKLSEYMAGLDADRLEWVATDDMAMILRIEREALSLYPRSKFATGTRFSLPVVFEYIGKRTDRRRKFEGALLQQVVGTGDSLEELKRTFPDAVEASEDGKEVLVISSRAGTFTHGFEGEEDLVWKEAYEGTIRGGPIVWGWSREMKQKSLDFLRAVAIDFDCFLATAVYGTYRSPALDTFRRFRDEVLLQTETGARFVALYYRIGPALANRLRRAPQLRSALKPVFDGLALWLQSVDMQDPGFRRMVDHLLRAFAPALPPRDERPPPPDFLRHFHPFTLGSPLRSLSSPTATEVSPWTR